MKIKIITLVFLIISFNQSLLGMHATLAMPIKLPKSKSDSSDLAKTSMHKSHSVNNIAVQLSDLDIGEKKQKKAKAQTPGCSPIRENKLPKKEIGTPKKVEKPKCAEQYKTLQNLFDETKTQLLLCLYISLHVAVNPEIWQKSKFERNVKNRVHSDLFSILGELAFLHTLRIEDRCYHRWLPIESSAIRRFMATTLVEMIIFLDIVMMFVDEGEGRDEKEAAITKYIAREYFESLIPGYQKVADFSHDNSPQFDDEKLKVLMGLSKLLLLDLLPKIPSASVPEKEKVMLLYCKKYCEKMDIRTLANFLRFFRPDQDIDLQILYNIILRDVKTQRYGPWLTS